MKKMAKILLMLVTGVALIVGNAISAPIHIDFAGGYEVTEHNNTGMLALDFSTILNTDYSGYIENTFEPSNDTLFSDDGIEFVKLSTLYFTEGVNGYEFNTTKYSQGFKVYDDKDSGYNLLFSATLNVSSIVEDGSTGQINPNFALNLTNIEKGASYVAGTSEIVDSFLNPIGGAIQITLNWGSDASLKDGSKSTYSGRAEPLPEPATIVLFGAGLIGLAAYGQVRRQKK